MFKNDRIILKYFIYNLFNLFTYGLCFLFIAIFILETYYDKYLYLGNYLNNINFNFLIVILIIILKLNYIDLKEKNLTKLNFIINGSVSIIFIFFLLFNVDKINKEIVNSSYNILIKNIVKNNGEIVKVSDDIKFSKINDDTVFYLSKNKENFRLITPLENEYLFNKFKENSSNLNLRIKIDEIRKDNYISKKEYDEYFLIKN